MGNIVDMVVIFSKRVNRKCIKVKWTGELGLRSERLANMSNRINSENRGALTV